MHPAAKWVRQHEAAVLRVVNVSGLVPRFVLLLVCKRVCVKSPENKPVQFQCCWRPESLISRRAFVSRTTAAETEVVVTILVETATCLFLHHRHLDLRLPLPSARQTLARPSCHVMKLKEEERCCQTYAKGPS